MIEDPYAAEAVHRLEARAHRHDEQVAAELRADVDRLREQAPPRPARSPRDELRAILGESAPMPAGHSVRYPRAELAEWPTAESTRYVRGEFVSSTPDACVASLRVQAQPYPLYAHDAAAALGVEGLVGVHVGFRWANVAGRWQVCRLDRESGEPAGPWVTVEPRTQTRE